MLTVAEFFALPISDREKIPHDQLDRMLETGGQDVIDSAEPTKRLKLQSIHARCRKIRKTIKHPLVVATKIFAMMNDEGLFQLNEAFHGLNNPPSSKPIESECNAKVLTMVRNNGAAITE